MYAVSVIYVNKEGIAENRVFVGNEDQVEHIDLMAQGVFLALWQKHFPKEDMEHALEDLQVGDKHGDFLQLLPAKVNDVHVGFKP